MNTTNNNLWAIILFTAAVVSLALGAIVVVWMKQQISVVAYDIKKSESELTVLDRDRAELSARIAQIHTPNHLLSRMRGLGLDLVPPTGEQLVWVNSPERASGNREVALSQTPFLRSVDSALYGSSQGGSRN